jgi:hypothetical protein
VVRLGPCDHSQKIWRDFRSQLGPAHAEDLRWPFGRVRVQKVTVLELASELSMFF